MTTTIQTPAGPVEWREWKSANGALRADFYIGEDGDNRRVCECRFWPADLSVSREMRVYAETYREKDIPLYLAAIATANDWLDAKHKGATQPRQEAKQPVPPSFDGQWSEECLRWKPGATWACLACGNTITEAEYEAANGICPRTYSDRPPCHSVAWAHRVAAGGAE